MSDIYACGLDLGTMFLQSMRDDGKGNIVSTTVRDCFREIDFAEEFEETLKAQKVAYLKSADKIYVLGNDAYLQAGMAEFAASGGGLQRPMKDGIINRNCPKIALTILRELMKTCVEQGIGAARPGEILYFSIPANPVDSNIDNTMHAKMAETFLKGLGYDARPLGEGLAIVFSENPKMHAPEGVIPFTGIGISMGAGMVNFCLAERGNPMDQFSVARSGDWIDERVAVMTGTSPTKVMRVKEKKLDFNKIDELSMGPDGDIVMGLDCYYTELVQYVFKHFLDRYKNKSQLEHPIDIVLSGGTASPRGFEKKVRELLLQMKLPFEINEVRTAGNGDADKMLKATARGCYLRAKQASKKAAQS
jgi:hypothetical protein